MTANRVFKVGDRVMYSAEFLRNIADYSADSADRRGTVREVYRVGNLQYVGINWDDGGNVGAVSSNLALAPNRS